MSDTSLANKEERNLRINQRDIDALLAAQLIVAWAGEKGHSDDPVSQRLGWWRTNLVGEGAEYEFKDLLPNTWRWAMLQVVRHAAKIHDASVRAKDHDPDRLLTLFSLGFEIDEKVDERLVQFKQNSKAIEDVLPDVASMINSDWSVDRFTNWVVKHGKESSTTVPAGRRLKGQPPEQIQAMLEKLIAGLAPLAVRIFRTCGYLDSMARVNRVLQSYWDYRSTVQLFLTGHRSHKLGLLAIGHNASKK